jgi:hypothetical protein
MTSNLVIRPYTVEWDVTGYHKRRSGKGSKEVRGMQVATTPALSRTAMSHKKQIQSFGRKTWREETTWKTKMKRDHVPDSWKNGESEAVLHSTYGIAFPPLHHRPDSTAFMYRLNEQCWWHMSTCFTSETTQQISMKFGTRAYTKSWQANLIIALLHLMPFYFQQCQHTKFSHAGLWWSYVSSIRR